MKKWISVAGFALVAGCMAPTEPQQPQSPAPTAQTQPKPQTTRQQTPKKSLIATQNDVARFKAVVMRVEPVAESICKQQAKNSNCDFKIVLDTRKNQPPNAYQSMSGGRPVLTVTQALLADVNNSDELAFVVGHEAAHHIGNHLARKQGSAMAGAVIAGGLATVIGAGGIVTDMATDIGASVGARSYSKNYELEADSLGTVITKHAGYNPVRGAAYFTRIPDPGNRFLGTHPPNAQRIETVKRVASKM